MQRKQRQFGEVGINEMSWECDFQPWNPEATPSRSLLHFPCSFTESLLVAELFGKTRFCQSILVVNAFARRRKTQAVLIFVVALLVLHLSFLGSVQSFAVRPMLLLVRTRSTDIMQADTLN